MAVNLGSNKTPYKKGPDGKIIPNKPEVATYNDKDGFTSKGDEGGGLKSSKKIKSPQTAETVAVESQGELLRYPLVNNYFASITYRMKTVNPWDVDLNTAKAIFDKTLLYDLNTTEKKKENAAPEQYDDAILRQARTENPDALDPRGNQIAPDYSDRVQQKEKQENEAFKGELGVTTSYVPGASQVSLYMPQALNIQDRVEYDTPELGARGAGVLSAINNAGSLGSAAAAALSQTFAPMTDLFNSDLTGQAARLAASRASSAFLPRDLAAAAQIGLQVKVNPNQRTLFSGVTIRPFTFQYDFIATSRAEAEQVNKIIRFFRTELYPSTFGQSETSIPLGYKFPNLFEVKFRWGASEMNVPQPLLCYLRDVQTTYNPGSMTFHADGNATHIQMTLLFQEFRALTKEDIEKGH